MATQDDVKDAYIKRSLTLLRAAEGEAIDVSRAFKKVVSIIEKDLEKTYATSKNVSSLNKRVDHALGSFYKDQLPKELFDIQKEVITREIIWNESTLESFREDDFVAKRESVPPPSKKAIKSFSAAASKKKYQGKTFARHIDKAFKGTSRRVQHVLKTGFNNGESIGQLMTDVRKVTGRSDRDVRTITRSYFMHNATEAKENVYKINPNVVEAIVWISTLDSRTTPLICGIRDGLLYTTDYEPIGHGEPWDAGPGRIHWNCRSTSAPKIKGIDQKASPRPSIGAGDNYKRGDNVTRTGRVRKPHKKAREDGVYKIDMRTTRTNYEGWLKGQSKSNIDFVSDVLGSKEKARQFRDGIVTLDDLKLKSPVVNPLNRTNI